MAGLCREFDISRKTGYKSFASLDLAPSCEDECLCAGFSWLEWRHSRNGGSFEGGP